MLPASHQRAAIARAEKQRRKNPSADADALLDSLRAEYKAEKLAEVIARVVTEAPPLTEKQRDDLTSLLRGNAA